MSYCKYVFNEEELELIQDHFPNYNLEEIDHIEIFVNGKNKRDFKAKYKRLCRDLTSEDIDKKTIDFYISEYECIVAAFPPKGGYGYVNVWSHFIKVKKEDAQ